MQVETCDEASRRFEVGEQRDWMKLGPSWTLCISHPVPAWLLRYDEAVSAIDDGSSEAVS